MLKIYFDKEGFHSDSKEFIELFCSEDNVVIFYIFSIILSCFFGIFMIPIFFLKNIKYKYEK